MKFEIKHRYSNEVLFSIEIGSLKLAVEAAVKSGANLCGANLCGANLTGVDLCGANLTGANLTGANLTGVDLCGANLTGVDLCGANLTGVDFSRANLTGANLCGANLTWVDLYAVNLYGANLTGANLTGVDLFGYVSIGPIGSRQSYLWTRWEESGFIVRTGCFCGTLGQFKKAIKETHKSGVHRDEYLAAIKLLEARMNSSKVDWEKHKKGGVEEP